MSRKIQGIIHLTVGLMGVLLASGLMDDAATVHGWSEPYKHYVLKWILVGQSGLQFIVGWIAQGYNTDGSKPDSVPQTTITETIPQPGQGPATITAVTEPVSRKES